MNRELLDPEDGENRAVRAFLMAYGCQPAITAEQMAQHMRRSGFDYVPDWVAEAPGHLTKGGAQLWLRMLFDLEEDRIAQYNQAFDKGYLAGKSAERQVWELQVWEQQLRVGSLTMKDQT